MNEIYTLSRTSYELRFGNSSIQAPEYDLEHFRADLTNTTDTLKPEKVESIISASSHLPKYDYFRNPVWVWAAIFLIALLLGFMSYRMMKDMGNKI